MIFGSTNNSFCSGFASIIQMKFEMSMMVESTLFLGLQNK